MNEILSLMKNKLIPYNLLVILGIFVTANFGLAQTSVYSFRSSVAIEKKLTDKLKFSIEPEIRFDKNFNTAAYLLETGVSYKLNSWLSSGFAYRFSSDLQATSKSAEGYFTENSNRFAANLNGKFKLNRFNSKAKIQFTNYTDFDELTSDKSNYLRYGFSTEYNLKSSKLTPFVSAEIYHKFKTGLLSKARYSAGLAYSFGKLGEISATYSYDDKFKTLTNYHIVELSYKFRF